MVIYVIWYAYLIMGDYAMAPNKKKRKNANYTSQARMDAREQHQIATSAKEQDTSLPYMHKKISDGWFSRFIMKKNDILAQNPNKRGFDDKRGVGVGK